MTEGNEFDRDKIIELLLLAQKQDRTVIEFQNRGGNIVAMELTDHVEELEKQVNE